MKILSLLLLALFSCHAHAEYMPMGSGGGCLTSPLTTKGDIWGFSTTNARIPVGANGTVLQADSTQALGVRWASVAGSISSINSDTTSAQTLATGTSGTDFVIVNGGGGLHTFNLPVASATNTGKLSNSDWSTFNGKIGPSDTATFLRLDGTNSPSAAISWNSQNLTGVANFASTNMFSGNLVSNPSNHQGLNLSNTGSPWDTRLEWHNTQNAGVVWAWVTGGSVGNTFTLTHENSGHIIQVDGVSNNVAIINQLSGPSILVGESSPSPYGNSLEVAGNGHAGIFGFGSGPGAGGSLQLAQAGNGIHAPTATLSGDELGSVIFTGYDGTNFNDSVSSSFSSFATQNFTSSAQGQQLVFQTVPNNSVTPTTALTLDQDQSSTFNGNMTISPATVSSANHFFNLTGTFPTTSADLHGVQVTISSGSNTTNNQGIIAAQFLLNNGGTGNSQQDVALYAEVATRSTGTSLTGRGNIGLLGISGPAGGALTTGINVGVAGNAFNGVNDISGAFYSSDGAVANSMNIGVIGSAWNTGSSGHQIGGYFLLKSSDSFSSPNISTALLADNGSSGSDIAHFQSNGSDAVVISPTGSALLLVSSTTQGFLAPVMTNTQMHAISSPTSGLMVYDSTNNTLDFYNGTAWQQLSFTAAP